MADYWLEVIVTGKASRDLDEWLSRIEADNPAAAEAFRYLPQ
jgi:hypothetical protein